MDIVHKDSSYQCEFSRLYLFEIWCCKSGTYTQRVEKVIDVILEDIKHKGYEPNSDGLKKGINNLCKQFVLYWNKNKRKKSTILLNHSQWLNKKQRYSLKSPIQQAASDSNRGRPKLDFAESSIRTKRRRIAEIAKRDETAASVLRSCNFQSCDKILEATTDEVLSLLMETNLTKHQYLLVRSFINSKLPCRLLPCYEKILKAKTKCYPEKIVVSESHAEVELQSLLDHTASRLLQLQNEVIRNVEDKSIDNLILIGKWGFDGSSGHAEYKQKFSKSELTDSNLFVTSFVPLRLVTNSEESKIVWKNPRPSSTRYCRPIRLQFKKETTELSISEERYFNDKIKCLTPTVFVAGNRKIQIEHSLQLTMVDGKICNALSQTSSSRCYICQAKPTEMNDLDRCKQKMVNEENYKFGLSPLHSYIRFFEYFIHVSYRLEIEVWKVCSEEQKKKLLIRKRLIQTKFRNEMGLIVDKPKAGGSGTSNDGNTARKFFNNPKNSADITGLDEELISRCSTLLQAMASGYKINPTKFGEYAFETAKRLVKKYPWYYLPPSVHKVLIHAPEVIKHCIVSIGELSEEAAESRNKDIKMFRLQHTRKISRESTNTDLINRLLLSSDPFISGQRKLPCKQKSTLLKSTVELLDDLI